MIQGVIFSGWTRMRDNRLQYLLWGAVVALGIGLRLPDLRHRPMHTDEAVHAVKLGVLLETGESTYDAREYHGPTLNVFTRIPAWIRGQSTFADLDEATLRIIPVCFGLLLILLSPLLVPLIGRNAALASALWIAVSPVQAYYSRYYIQETLFVCFAFALLVLVFRYLRARRWIWALGAGVALGMLHATKETDILVLGAAAAAGSAVWLDERIRRPSVARSTGRLKTMHGLIFLLAAVLVAGFFFSSFFTKPGGFLDSFRTYRTYFHRGTGQTLHVHPWYYYFRLLFFFHVPGKPVWSEAWFLPFAFLGAHRVFRHSGRAEGDPKSGFGRFLVVYTLVLGAVFSSIPYKTPWNVLGFHHGLLLLAGLGTAELFHAVKNRNRKAGVVALLAVSLSAMAGQAVLLNRTYDSDPCNPWVYAHPGPDVHRISETVEAAAAAGPDGLRTHVEVVVPGHGYWPLPWTLRRLKNVGWYDAVDLRVPAAPIVLVAPEREPALVRKLYDLPPPGQRHLYLRLWEGYAELRPAVEIRGYIRKDLHDLSH